MPNQPTARPAANVNQYSNEYEDPADAEAARRAEQIVSGIIQQQLGHRAGQPQQHTHGRPFNQHGGGGQQGGGRNRRRRRGRGRDGRDGGGGQQFNKGQHGHGQHRQHRQHGGGQHRQHGQGQRGQGQQGNRYQQPRQGGFQQPRPSGGGGMPPSGPAPSSGRVEGSGVPAEAPPQIPVVQATTVTEQNLTTLPIAPLTPEQTEQTAVTEAMVSSEGYSEGIGGEAEAVISSETPPVSEVAEGATAEPASQPQQSNQQNRRSQRWRDRSEGTSVAPERPPQNVRKVVLLNATEPGEIRVAILENNELAEIFMERKSRSQQAGNIYKGRIVNVEPSLQAAFVDLGTERNGFLHASDCIPPDGGYRDVLGELNRGKQRGQKQQNAPVAEQQPAAQSDVETQASGDAATQTADAAATGSAQTTVEGQPAATETANGRPAPASGQPAAADGQSSSQSGRRRRRRRGGRGRSGRGRLPGAAPMLAPSSSGPEQQPVSGNDFVAERESASIAPAETAVSNAETAEGQNGGRSEEVTSAPDTSTTVEPSSDAAVTQDAAPAVDNLADRGNDDAPPSDEPNDAEDGENGDGDSAQDDIEKDSPRHDQVSDENDVREDDDSSPLPSNEREELPDGDDATDEPLRPRDESSEDSGRFEAVRGDDIDDNGGSIAEVTDVAAGEADADLNDTSVVPLSDTQAESAEQNGGESPNGDATAVLAETVVGEGAAVAPIPAPGQPHPFARNKRGSGRSGRERHDRRYTIQEMMKEGQEVLVQVAKEGIGQKGPALTTYLSMPGRYLVLMPAVQRLGVSKRIENDEQRRALKDALAQLNPPDDMGVIVRTAGMGRTKDELQRDMDYLMRMWDTLKKKTKMVKAPALIFQEGDVVTRVFRDVITDDVAEIIIDDPIVLERAREFMRETAPGHEHKLKLHSDAEPLFHKYGVEQQMQRLFNRKVNMRNGGSIVIEQTEALVAIDVNTGRYREKRNQDDTILQTNLEAAREIARQLRLRDIGGLVMIDFIDMEIHEHRRRVERELKSHLARDKARINVLSISQLGVVEMTRQRVRHSLRKTLFDRCPHCSGSGHIKSGESLGLEILREIKSQTRDQNVRRVKVLLNSSFAFEILNTFRKELVRMEESKGITIEVCGDPGVPLSQIQVSTAKEGGEWVLKKVSEVDDYVRNS